MFGESLLRPNSISCLGVCNERFRNLSCCAIGDVLLFLVYDEMSNKLLMEMVRKIVSKIFLVRKCLRSPFQSYDVIFAFSILDVVYNVL